MRFLRPDVSGLTVFPARQSKSLREKQFSPWKYGNPERGLTLSYPEESVQYLVGADSWWVKDDKPFLCRGRLIRACVPHVDQIPTKMTVIGRTDDATCHDKAHVHFSPHRIKDHLPPADLPVAALPTYPNEVRLVYRAKRRPLIVIGESGPEVDRELNQGKPKHQTAPTLLAAPFYGCDEGTGERSGYMPAFVERVRQCEYPQFFWDKLPLPGADESLLRFDHIQPVGNHHDTFEMTEYRLGDDAMAILDEWLRWLVYRDLEDDGILRMVICELQK